MITYTAADKLAGVTLNVTESNDSFDGGAYTAGTDAANIAAWLEHVTADGGTVTAVTGTVATGELARLDRILGAAGLRRSMSAPVGAGYAVTYGPTLATQYDAQRAADLRTVAAARSRVA